LALLAFVAAGLALGAGLGLCAEAGVCSAGAVALLAAGVLAGAVASAGGGAVSGFTALDGAAGATGATEGVAVGAAGCAANDGHALNTITPTAVRRFLVLTLEPYFIIESSSRYKQPTL
jgi:hypothetical protein